MPTLPLALALALPLALVFALAGCTSKLVCPDGQVVCGNACVDLAIDGANCGACGNACGTLGVCAAGNCGCAPGAVNCGGTCADLRSDPAHCGACATACSGGTPACAEGGCAASCGPLHACGNACVDEQADRFNCGACGHACPAGQACRASACHADLQVACGATSEIIPVGADLSAAGPGRAVTAGLTVMAVSDATIFAGSGYPVAAVDLVPLDPSVGLGHVDLVGSSDVEGIAVHDRVAFLANASVGAIDVVSPDGVLLDEVVLAGQQSFPNPHGLAFSGDRAYVALYGSGPGSGQGVAVLDFSGLSACSMPGASPCGAGGACGAGLHCAGGTCRPPCGVQQKTIDLTEVPGAADSPGLPFPSRVVVSGGKAYVTLANLKIPAGGSFYMEPAGNGKLAVIDPAAGDAVSIVDLGRQCGNPGGLALDGGRLWVACGSYTYSVAWPGAVVPVTLGATPAVGAAVDVSAVIPNGVTLCGGKGYVPDMATGAVLRFDPSAGTAEPPVAVCPSIGYAYVQDVACAP
jgi:hypothetical protein